MLDKVAISAVAMAMATSASGATQAAAPQSPLIESLVRCKAEVSETARLRCYDAAAGALTEASSKGEVLVVNREDVRKTRRSLFGFNLPKLPFFSGDDSGAEEAKEIQVGIASARMIESGKYRLRFDDGSTWQTTEAKPIRPRVGETVTIKKAALGSYFLRVGGRSVRGMRID